MEDGERRTCCFWVGTGREERRHADCGRESAAGEEGEGWGEEETYVSSPLPSCRHTQRSHSYLRSLAEADLGLARRDCSPRLDLIANFPPPALSRSSRLPLPRLPLQLPRRHPRSLPLPLRRRLSRPFLPRRLSRARSRAKETWAEEEGSGGGACCEEGEYEDEEEDGQDGGDG